MTRTPLAAKTLAKQIKAKFPETEIEYGDRDGFGVHRSLYLSGEAADWIGPALEALAVDQRISRYASAKGEATVEFVSDRRADDATKFPISDVLRVLQGDSEDEAQSEGYKAPGGASGALEGASEDAEVVSGGGAFNLEEHLSSLTVKEMRAEYPEFKDFKGKRDELVEAILQAS